MNYNASIALSRESLCPFFCRKQMPPKQEVDVDKEVYDEPDPVSINDHYSTARGRGHILNLSGRVHMMYLKNHVDYCFILCGQGCSPSWQQSQDILKLTETRDEKFKLRTYCTLLFVCEQYSITV